MMAVDPSYESPTRGSEPFSLWQQAQWSTNGPLSTWLEPMSVREMLRSRGVAGVQAGHLPLGPVPSCIGGGRGPYYDLARLYGSPYLCFAMRLCVQSFYYCSVAYMVLGTSCQRETCSVAYTVGTSGRDVLLAIVIYGWAGVMGGWHWEGEDENETTWAWN